MPNLRLSSEPDASRADVDSIDDRIAEYNIRVTGFHDYAPVRIFLRDEGGKICGGLIGHVWGRWLKIELLWIADDFRTQGYGSRLLEEAEAQGRANGAFYAYVDTFSFQAPEFYKRYSYAVVAEYADFPPGHSHFFMRKTL